MIHKLCAYAGALLTSTLLFFASILPSEAQPAQGPVILGPTAPGSGPGAKTVSTDEEYTRPVGDIRQAIENVLAHCIALRAGRGVAPGSITSVSQCGDALVQYSVSEVGDKTRVTFTVSSDDDGTKARAWIQMMKNSVCPPINCSK
jgi:hypothetical protein